MAFVRELDFLSVCRPHCPEHTASGLDTRGLTLTVLDQRKLARVENSGTRPFHACGLAGALQCIHRPRRPVLWKTTSENVTCAVP